MPLNRILVIGGGGSKGAFAVGAIEQLLQSGIQYDAVIGCSTGSLIAPFVALGEIDTLVQMYSTVTTKDIYISRGFDIAFHRSFYDAEPLWQTITRMFTPAHNFRLLSSPTDVYLLPTHLQSGQ